MRGTRAKQERREGKRGKRAQRGEVLPAPEFKGHIEERRRDRSVDLSWPSEARRQRDLLPYNGLPLSDEGLDRLIAAVLPNRPVDLISGATRAELEAEGRRPSVVMVNGEPRLVPAEGIRPLNLNFENTPEQIKARYDAIADQVANIDDEEDETAAILADPEAVAAIDEGLADLDAGRFDDIEENDGLDDLGIVGLRKAAKPYKISGAWSMKSAELRAAIREARRG